MKFYVGIHHAHTAGRTPLSMVSANVIRKRKSCIPANDWIMDSGAFTLVNKHGGYPHPVEEYAEIIRRFAHCGNLQIAVAQDYMCEQFVLNRTGLTVHDHQRLTIERYDALLACDTAGIPIMPVLQGYEAHEYLEHMDMYGDRLTEGMWVGVGSVCRRNTNPGTIRHIVQSIHDRRPDLRLHGFGVKLTALRDEAVNRLFYSTDSMAWSYHAYKHGRDNDNFAEAIRYAHKVNTQPIQTVLF